jgi:hypothetical protein
LEHGRPSDGLNLFEEHGVGMGCNQSDGVDPPITSGRAWLPPESANQFKQMDARNCQILSGADALKPFLKPPPMMRLLNSLVTQRKPKRS